MTYFALLINLYYSHLTLFITSMIYRLRRSKVITEREIFLDGIGMHTKEDEVRTVDDLRDELDDLKSLVNTLLTIIMEEADGIQNSAAPSLVDTPRRGYCM